MLRLACVILLAASCHAPRPAQPARFSQILEVDAARSSVELVVSGGGEEHRGTYREVTGTINLAPSLRASAVTIDVSIRSLETEDALLTADVLSRRFLDAARYPNAVFVSSTIEPPGRPGDPYLVTGSLEVLGRRRTVTFPATIVVVETEVTATASVTIDRRDFGIASAGDERDVAIHVRLLAPR